MPQDEQPKDEKLKDETPVSYLTVTQAAAELGVTRGWIHRLVRGGRLPAVKRACPIGDYWEIASADLDKVRGLKHTGRPPKK